MYSFTGNCGNWDCGRAIPFLGIFGSNFRYWFFAVHGCNVMYAVLWLLPFAYMAAKYAVGLRRALYLTQYMATWLYCLQRDGLGSPE